MSLRDSDERLAAADVARPRVVGDEVAGRDVEVLEEERVPAVGRQAVARARQRHDHFVARRASAARGRARHAEVVVGARLDQHFLERRHLAVAGRPQDADVGRPIEQRADEVLGVAGVSTPSSSASATRYEPSAPIVSPPRGMRPSTASGTRVPSSSTSALAVTGRSAVTVSRTVVPAGA